jgi:hypothetical protein
MKRSPWCVSSLLATVLAGCHSYHIDTVVENRTHEPLQLLEVDYPTASFGKNALADGGDYHYRIQVQGHGHLKVGYTAASGKPVEIDGPELAEGQEGRLEVVLLPLGKAEFHLELKPRR